METLAPVPKIGETYWFYIRDKVSKDTEFQAKVMEVLTYKESENRYIYKYDDEYQEVVPIPIAEFWLNQASEMFWVFAGDTDYIIRLSIPKLCPQDVFIARDQDGGWHAFETTRSDQYGILDILGNLYNQLHETV